MQQHNFSPGAIPSQRNYWRLVLLFLLPVLIVIGIILGVISIINIGAATYAQPDALFYTANGHTVMATVVTHESGATETYIDNNRYAEAIDVENGKRLWRVLLDAKNNRDQDFGHAALLGQSSKYLFFLRNELYVIDKQTGEVVAQNDHFETIKDKMSKEELTSYNSSDIKYAYSDSLKAVLFKGTDGLFYSINGVTLKADIIHIINSDEYFKPTNQPSYNSLMVQAYDDGKQSLVLLDEKEVQLLQANKLIEGVQHRSVEKSVRRSLYSHPVDKLSGNWKKVNEAVYIYGGFLTDPHQGYRLSTDSLANNETYRLFANNYNNIHAPIRLNNGGLIVMHKASMENTSPVLLTAILPDGKVIWQANTGYADIGFLYKQPDGDKLFFMGTPAGKFNYPMQQLLCLNLANGALQSYPIK
ncbi:hypothetical protein SAMN05421821_10329 [Mucilaginibacter lappiensis]|uniref:PQQ-like domain-containing protein n=1 Tax=Mucilaginibacter lappiensis TaxID=354630 RepID=A0ABR6PHS7_9SPHI|nr:PA2928 family protein [Mucilaginibacter lappiensis]MBB6108794.1 hypothetical protein [Mucilaginibacter lappiensis]SIQ62490.1 hypothetical protein SAMN05421821_10329 [Mucilaginibacter lappiensis]